MSAEVRQSIADSRAQYFSDFSGDPETLEDLEDCDRNGDNRKPSYVGLSHAVNGYTPYSQYNGRVKKISPPLQIPVSHPRHLDSVGLVLSQDSYHRSVTEFEQVMRDLSNGSGLDMGRPQRNSDVIDATSNGGKRPLVTSSNGDSYYPKTSSRQVLEGESVEIVTKFHCDEDHSPTYTRASPNGSRQNLVQKQIERLYGDNPHAQVRVTSPEPEGNGHGPSPPRENGDTKQERKTSGGFFAKRFGVIKMKDHRSQKIIETSNGGDSPAMDFKPLKVPAVFRLLRPEFREQLKQSSCIQDKAERIIPIRREGENGKTNGQKSATPERVVPIAVSPGHDVSNGSLNNNNSSKTTPAPSERVIPIRRESGDINSTPKRPVGFAPKVNGFNTSPSKTISKPSEDNNEKAEASSKPSIVRKLSPLSPKHIVVPGSIGEKPAPPTKPEHLKSPPMSPEPVSGSPNMSPTPPSSSSSLVPDPESKVVKPVEPVAPPTQPDSDDSSGRHLESEQNGVSEPRNGAREGPLLLSKDTTVINNTVTNNNHKTEAFIEEAQGDADYQEDNPEEYPEEYYYDNPAPCGLRERELLCPIMEEDNESTASGSIVNLAPSNNGSVIGNCLSPDDPLLEQGEIQDGHYFIKVLENEIFKFEENICDFEEDLNSQGSLISDEVRDTILVVIGMAKLLMAQKLTQFRELCYKNINVSVEVDPFVPTSQDLAGFWDMVSIQVDQIHDRFSQLADLRKADWIVKKPEVVKNNKTAAKKTPVAKSKPKEKSEAAKARDEARRKMLEERKRMMKQNKARNAANEDGGDMILIM